MSFIISAIESRDLISIKQKLILLYTLNVSDIIFTLFLVNTDMFYEANDFMAILLNNVPLISIIIKIAVPLILLIGVYRRMQKATQKQLYQSNIIITGCLAFYGLINIFHVIWCMLFAVMRI